MHSKTICNSLCLIFIWLCFSCSGGMEKKAFVKWIKDPKNGLMVQHSVNGYHLELQHTPTEYLVLQYAEEIDEKGFNEMKEEYDDLQYYTLKVSATDQKDFIEYGTGTKEEKQRKLYYFSYQFQNDIRIEENDEQFPCVLFHFERNGSIQNSRTFVLAFERNPTVPSKETKLIVQSDYFGPDPVTLLVKKAHIPNLKL